VYRQAKFALRTSITSVVVSATLVAIAPGIANAAVAPLGGTRIGVVVVGDQSEQDALAAAASRTATNHRTALTLIEAWAGRIRSGQPVQLRSITQGTTPAAQLRQLAALQSRIESAPVGAAPSSAKRITPLFDGNDPNSFSVRGSAGSGRLYWQGLNLAVAYHYCDLSGCEPDTDRITCGTTVNPGAITSRIDYNCLYFPNAGNFQNRHFRLWALNRGIDVTYPEPDNWDVTFDSSDSIYLDYTRDLNATVLTVAIALWVYIIPDGGFTGVDGAKTADATCHSAPNNSCVY
jgi:hypothetical protein